MMSVHCTALLSISYTLHLICVNKEYYIIISEILKIVGGFPSYQQYLTIGKCYATTTA